MMGRMGCVNVSDESTYSVTLTECFLLTQWHSHVEHFMTTAQNVKWPSVCSSLFHDHGWPSMTISGGTAAISCRLNILNNKVSPLCQGDLERAFCNSRMVTNAFLLTTKIFRVSVCLSMFVFVCSGRWRSGEASHWWLSIGCHLWPCKGEVMKN